MDGPGPNHIVIGRALATLPDNQRRAMVLRYFADLPVTEIAARESVPEGTVRSWLHRGRVALAAQLRPAHTPQEVHHA